MNNQLIIATAEELRNLVVPLQRNIYEKTYAAYGDLNALQCNILTALNENGKTGLSDLARYLGTSNQRLTRPLADLVGRGLVEKSKDGFNQKNVFVSITQSGKDIEDRVHMYLTKNIGFLMSFLSDEEANDFYNALLTMKRTLKQFDSI